MLDLFLTVFLWGFSFALAKKALAGFSPFELVTIRLALGAVTAFGLALVMKPRSRSGARFSIRWTAPVILGVFEFAGTYIFYTWSLSYLPSGVVGTLTLMTPVITFLAAMLMGVESFSGRAAWASALSLLGAALCFPMVSLFGKFSSSSGAIFGFGLLMTSNVFFAVGNVFISKWEKRSQWSQLVTAQGLAVGAVISAVVCVLVPHSPSLVALTWKIWILPVYLGVVATGVGFFLWNRGVQKISATPASVIGNFKAPLSLVWGAVLLDEKITPQLLAGLLLLFAAVLVLPSRKKVA